MKSFDTILISASPLALTEALLLARSGQRVLVVDRRPTIGGAWRSADVLGYTNVEVGCHLFIEHPAVPIMAAQVWGLALAPLVPVPTQHTYLAGRLFEERYGSSGYAAVREGLGAVRKSADGVFRRQRQGGSWPQTARAYWRSLKHAKGWLGDFRTRHHGFYYPPGGTAEIVSALRARADEAGISLWLGREALSASITGSSAQVDLDSGESVVARQLVLTRGSQLRTLNGLNIPERARIRWHWVVVVDDMTPRAFSYLQFIGHPLLERVSDVTTFARTLDGRPVEAGRKIVCFFVRNDAYTNGPAAAEEQLLALMRRHKWLGPRATPVVHGWWQDEETNRSYRFLADLTSGNPAVRVIPHINLGRYLVDNLSRVSDSSEPSA